MEFSLFPRHYSPDYPSSEVVFIGDVITPDRDSPRVILTVRYAQDNIGIKMHTKDDRKPIGGIIQPCFYPQIYDLSEPFRRQEKSVDDLVDKAFKDSSGGSDIVEVEGEYMVMELDGKLEVTSEFSNLLGGYGREIFYRISQPGNDRTLFQLRADANKVRMYDPLEKAKTTEALLSHVLHTVANEEYH